MLIDGAEHGIRKGNHLDVPRVAGIGYQPGHFGKCQCWLGAEITQYSVQTPDVSPRPIDIVYIKIDEAPHRTAESCAWRLPAMFCVDAKPRL